MKRISLFSFFIVLIVTAISCKKNNITNSDHEVTLYHCEGSQSNKTTPYICFDSLITDSRCPLNTNCPWIGNAIVLVSFNENMNIHQFKMSLQNYPNGGFISDTTINGYKVIFSKLQPYPDGNKPAPLPSEIKATFIITK